LWLSRGQKNNNKEKNNKKESREKEITVPTATQDNQLSLIISNAAAHRSRNILS